MKKQIIQGLWVGRELREIEIMSIKSFLMHGFEYHLYVYDEIQNIPDGTVIKDANIILDKKNLKLYGKKYAIFSDWFRWELLYRQGGIWMDMDMICLQAFQLEQQKYPLFAREGFKLYATGFLAFEKHHFLTDVMRKACQFPNSFTPYDTLRYKIKKLVRKIIYKNDITKIPWGESGGPKGFTKAIKYYKLEEHAFEQNLIYPIHGFDYLDIFTKEIDLMRSKIENAYTLHLFNELINKNKLDMKKITHKHSLINFLKKRYLS
ncbi:glycosyltransferase [Sulfurimonas sp.]|uniref:glycosyltransferase n=1 Tax=Sulfurimonas sp. TaxID=2022749 RepID=UPI0019E3B7A1|nr:glycosyltransferase [Sulfurimonas sp.]MBE0515688.1 hypothetical protein [Sulfurimonas sp.]